MRVLEILTSDVASLISYYQQLKIYKSSTENGTYVSVGTVTLSGTTSVYPYIDNSGLTTDFYKFSYNRTTAPTAESELFVLGQNYASVASLKNRLNETGEDISFVEALIAATEQVRRYCGREFYQKIETRYFEGTLVLGGKSSQYNGPQKLQVDDLLSVTSIALDYSGGTPGAALTTLTLNTHCYLFPQDAPQRFKPYEIIDFIPSASLPAASPNYGTSTYPQGLYWPRGYQAIRITGTWGWPVNNLTNSPIPADVREATLQIAARIYKGRDNAYSRVTGNAAQGTLQIGDSLLNKDVIEMLKPYKKVQVYW